MSLFEIKCPICKCKIWVESSTGRLVDHESADHKKINLDDYMKSQKDRGSELENKFKNAKEEQVKRKEQMEKDFMKAKEHPEELKGDYQSPFQWE